MPASVGRPSPDRGKVGLGGVWLRTCDQRDDRPAVKPGTESRAMESTEEARTSAPLSRLPAWVKKPTGQRNADRPWVVPCNTRSVEFTCCGRLHPPRIQTLPILREEPQPSALAQPGPCLLASASHGRPALRDHRLPLRHVVDIGCSYLSSQAAVILSLNLCVRQVSVPHMASSHRQTRLSPCFTRNP